MFELSISRLFLKYSVSEKKFPLLSESLYVVVLNIFILSFLRLNVPEPLLFFGDPILPLTLPLKPSKSCFFKIIFKIPAVPSAEYLADGDVTTSTFSIDSEGIDLSPCGPDRPTRPDGLPLINILTLLFPLNEILPSKSTSIDGMLAKTSDTFPPLTVMSCPTLYIFLSSLTST